MNLAAPEVVIHLDEWPKVEGHDMEFALVYDGPLYSATNRNPRAEHKHEIRRQFHPQLKKFWELRLNHWLTGTKQSATSRRISAGSPVAADLGEHFSKGSYNFVPLVREDLCLACRLDIFFLRRDPSRTIIKSGDIDNRLKTLFDALRIPQFDQELADTTAQADEKPFFCLLEDDSLITEVHVSTDTLLTPCAATEMDSAKLILGVKLRPFQATDWNADFY